MSKKAEMMRISNFIEKEVTVLSLEEVYASLIHLDEIKEKVKLGMDTLINYLFKNGVKPEQYFLEQKKKIVYTQGKTQTTIPASEIFNKLSNDDFLKIVTVVAAELKKLPEGNKLIALHKKDTGTGKDSISVKKMTKDELTEHAKKV